MPRCGRAAWAPLPSISMVSASAAAIIGPGADAKGADRHAGIIVHAVDFADAEAVDHPVIDHGLAAGTAFLGGLEDHHRGAGEIARLGKIARGAEQHGGVPIMTAGMHLAGNGRFVWQVVRLFDRQRVHVGAQADRLAATTLAAANDADHAGPADAGHDLVAAEGLQFFGDGAGRALHVVQQLRDAHAGRAASP